MSRGASARFWLRVRQEGQRRNKVIGAEADGYDAGDEADDVFVVVGAVGVLADAGAFVFGDLVHFDDPVQGGA